MVRLRTGVQPGRRGPLRAVAVPAEHGGWGLTLEPILLGLLVAPSGAGVALGAAAFTAFLARTPLKLALVDRHRHRRLPRTALAERVAAAELAVVCALAGLTALLADESWWVPLALAAPLVAVELWFDVRSRSRRLVPELCGAIGIASVAAAIALAGGAARSVSAGLWLVLATRSLASVPFARLQVRRIKEQTARRAGADLAQVGAVALAAVGWATGIVPAPALAAIAALALFQGVASRRDPPKVAVLGAQQVLAGLAIVVITALAVAGP